MSTWLERWTIGWRPHALIAFVLCACALPGLIGLQPLDRDESRFAQATTQMFESGDFIKISFQDEPRNKKPIGIHWLQAASVALTGGPETRTIQAFRIPSLFGALLCALSVFQIGALLKDRQTGLVAALALATGLLLSTEAGIAKTDACLAGLIALAYLGLASARSGQAKSGAWCFWIGFGAAALIKGPIGPLLLLMSMIGLVVIERKWAWLKALFHGPSMLVAFCLVVPWYVAIWKVTNGQFFMDAVSQDLAPKLAGKAENPSIPPGAHLLLSPIIMWPGSVLIPAAIWAGWKFRSNPNVLFLLAWAVPGWIMFEAAPAKLAHYTLPVHGGVLLLGAWGLMSGAWERASLRWLSFGLLALGGFVMTALPLVLAKDVAASAQPLAEIGTAMIGLSVLTGLFLMWRQSRYLGLSLGVSALVVSLFLKGLFVPHLPELRVSERVSEALLEQGLHPRLSPGKPGPLIGFGYQEPSLIFATRSDSALATIEGAVAAAKPGSGIVLINDPAALATFTNALAARNLRPRWRDRVVSGLNYSKGDPVTLMIGEVRPQSELIK